MLDAQTAQALGQGAQQLANIPLQFGSAVLQQQEQKRIRQFQEGFTILSAGQQQYFNQQLLNANTDTETLAILMQAITAINLAKVNNAGSSKNTALFAVVAVAIVILIAVFILNKQ